MYFKYFSCIVLSILLMQSCEPGSADMARHQADTIDAPVPDTTRLTQDEYSEMVRYGHMIMKFTAQLIGPEGSAGRYTRNKMACTNCHQWEGTKPYSFNLMRSLENYPQYRGREGRVITLADRINNCVMRPHNGIPLPHDSREMIALQAYYRWINAPIKRANYMRGEKNLEIEFPEHAAQPERGKILYHNQCSRCHGINGEGHMDSLNQSFRYPPLWGPDAYQSGSSMHRITKMAGWLKANMPHDLATWNRPVLKDEEALDIAAFINDDRIHQRPQPLTMDYPNRHAKAIDYDKGPYPDPFSEMQHKFGPYPPIIAYWKAHQMKLKW